MSAREGQATPALLVQFPKPEARTRSTLLCTASGALREHLRQIKVESTVVCFI